MLPRSQATFFFIFSYIFIERIRVTLVNRMYRLQVYNSVTHHLCTALCAHHPTSRLFLSAFIPLYPPCLPTFPVAVTILLSVWVSFFLNLCTHFTQPLNATSLQQLSVCFLCL